MTTADFAWLAVPARGLATTLFVSGVIWLMERSSPFIGGIVLALPIVTAPAYFFILLQHDPVFVAHAALGSLATLGAVLLFLATAIAMLRRFPMRLALPSALAAWFATGLLIDTLPASLATSLAVLILAALTAAYAGARVPLTAPAARGRSPLYEVLLRGAAAGLLVASVSALAGLLGPRLSGVFASFPVALLVVCAFLPRRLDVAGIRAGLRATQIGLASHVPFFLSLILLGPAIGGYPAFLIGSAGSLGVALLLGLVRLAVTRRRPGA
ncbi:MAG TPA: hypothetical protein VF194_18135 [Ferrovibrio sp.]|uniref:hypothetical protein n=1 Tax=Ferrovibrio sp. TaxID=1917215 RepID=UPI002ED5188A